MGAKLNGRRVTGLLVLAGAAVCGAWTVLAPAGADPGPTPATTTTVAAEPMPQNVSVFGDSITHSVVAQASVVNERLDDPMQVSWNTFPGVSTYQWQSGFDEVGVDQPDVVVIATGTNDAGHGEIGEAQAAWIDHALDALAANPCVVWVDVRGEISPDHTAWNLLLKEKAAAAGNVRVADWDVYSTGHPEWIIWDTVHLSDQGKFAYASWLVEQMVLGCP